MSTIKLDAERMTAVDSDMFSTGSPTGCSTPCPDAVNEFNRALEGKNEHHRDAGDQNSARKDDDAPDDAGTLCGDTVLQSLFGNRNLTAMEKAAESASAPPSTDMTALVTSVADQILVSDPRLSGQTEVRIMINDSILPGTELHLTRGADGLLTITMLTSDAAAHQSLVAAQDTLKTCLEQHESSPVRIDINQRSEAESGDQRRRSRGLVDMVEKNA